MPKPPRAKPTQAQLKKLWAAVTAFVDRHDISCGEVVYQSDRVIENAYELVNELAQVVGYAQVEEDDFPSDEPPELEGRTEE